MKHNPLSTLLFLSLFFSQTLFSSDVEESTPTDAAEPITKIVMCKFNQEATAEEAHDEKTQNNCEAPFDYSINDQEYFIPQE